MPQVREYEVTINQLEAGISLSRKNALRLARDAEVLRAYGGSRESVYALWHFAVEELGKSKILKDCMAKEVSPRKVKIPNIFEGDSHPKKFKDGLSLLPQTKKTGLALAVTVTDNRSAMNRTLKDPPRAKGTIKGTTSIIPGATGRFEDSTPGSGTEPSHDLRLRLQFVDFDGTSWREPEVEFRDSEITAKISVSPEDLKRAIDELLAVLSTVKP